MELLIWWLMRIISWSFRFYEFFILLNVIFSWIRPNPNIAFVDFVYKITVPFLDTIGRFLPRVAVYPLDFSPMVAIFLLSFIENLTFKLLIFLMV